MAVKGSLNPQFLTQISKFENDNFPFIEMLQSIKSEVEEEINMWICPKCGKELKRTNQGHYCGKSPETVLELI